MKNEPTVEVEVDPQGNVTIEVSGVVGNSCHALTRDVENALGKVTEVHDKPEARQLGGTSQQQQLGGSLV